MPDGHMVLVKSVKSELLKKLFSSLPEPRCKVNPVLGCEAAPSRRKTVASPLLYRAGPWAAQQAPRAHAPVQGRYSVLLRDIHLRCVVFRDCSGYGLTGYVGYESVTGYKILTG